MNSYNSQYFNTQSLSGASGFEQADSLKQYDVDYNGYDLTGVENLEAASIQGTITFTPPIDFQNTAAINVAQGVNNTDSVNK